MFGQIAGLWVKIQKKCLGKFEQISADKNTGMTEAPLTRLYKKIYGIEDCLKYFCAKSEKGQSFLIGGQQCTAEKKK